MNTYLAIITTILVATQIIRVIQNAINLRGQNKLIKAQLGELSDINDVDIKNRREADKLIIKYLRDKVVDDDYQ